MGPHILLVNSSADAQEHAKELVARKGCVPVMAANAYEALFHLRSRPIDAIVCEAHPPGRDSRWLREQVGRSHPDTLFIVSSSGTGADWERALERLQPLEPAVPVERLPESPLVSPVVVEERAIELEQPADERRRAQRFRPTSHLPVLLRSGREGLVRDVSVGGALIETNSHVGRGGRFDVRFGPDILRVAAEVVRCHVVAVRPDGITYRVAVAFKAPVNESDVKRLLDRGDG